MNRRNATTLLGLLCALGLSSVSPAQEAPPRIAEVRFEGAPWIPRERLLAVAKLQPGQILDPDSLADALRRLLAWPRIARVVPRLVPTAPGQVRLELAIEVHRWVRSISFRGLLHLTRRQLLQGLEIAEGSHLLPGAVDDARAHLLARAEARGFYLASVSAEILPVDEIPDAVDLVFSIDESKRVSIRSIQFSGNDSIPSRHLRAAMQLRRRLLFGLISEGFLESQRLEEDLEKLRDLYRSRGYLEAIVIVEDVEFTEDLQQIDLKFRIHEGRRFELAGFALEGHNPALTRALQRQITHSGDGYYDEGAVQEDLLRLQRFYQSRTFRTPSIRIEHRFDLDASPPLVTVVFRIDERDHLFAGLIEIEGNEGTRDRVVRSRLDLEPLGPLTPLQLQQSAGRLSALRQFESAQTLTITAPDRVTPAADRFPPPESWERFAEPGRVKDVRVQIVEQSSGLFEVGGGASSGKGEVFTIRLDQPNFDLFDIPGGKRGWERPFYGGGQHLQIAVNPGTKISEFHLGFEEPYVYSTRNALSLNASNSIIRWRQYDENRVGGRLGLRRYWDDERRVSTRLSWVIQDVELDDIDPLAPAELTEFEGHTFLSYPSLTVAYSDRELDRFRGPVGLRASTRFDAAGRASGSEVGFLRSLTRLDLHMRANAWLNAVLPGEPLAEDIPSLDHVLHIGASFGWMEGIGGEDTPFFEHFFLGGPANFRGFAYRRLGPHSGGVPVGGEAFWNGTVQYSLPLFLREFRLLGLFDFGDIEPSFSDFAASRIRTSAGVGLLLRLRLMDMDFPVNLYWVEALRKERDDRPELFSFSLGYEF